jgi:hypothetical protein
MLKLTDEQREEIQEDLNTLVEVAFKKALTEYGKILSDKMDLRLQIEGEFQFSAEITEDED